MLPVRNTKAFTLLELIVVIVILGILAAIAIPTFQKTITKSKKASMDQTLTAVDRDSRALAALDDTPVDATYLTEATTEVKGDAARVGTFNVATDGKTVQLTRDGMCRQLTVVLDGSGTLADCSALTATQTRASLHAGSGVFLAEGEYAENMVMAFNSTSEFPVSGVRLAYRASGAGKQVTITLRKHGEWGNHWSTAPDAELGKVTATAVAGSNVYAFPASFALPPRMDGYALYLSGVSGLELTSDVSTATGMTVSPTARTLGDLSGYGTPVLFDLVG